MGLVDRVRQGRAEYVRRLEALQTTVTESPVRLAADDEPQPTDDGEVVWLHVEDEDAWRAAWDAVDEMPWWSKW